MKYLEHLYIDPVTFNTVGPHALKFNWDITDDQIFAWTYDMREYEGQDVHLWVDADRMIKYPVMIFYANDLRMLRLFCLNFEGLKQEWRDDLC